MAGILRHRKGLRRLNSKPGRNCQESANDSKDGGAVKKQFDTEIPRDMELASYTIGKLPPLNKPGCPRFIIYNAQGFEIAIVDGNTITEPENEQHAKLFAAAPDLLAALKECITEDGSAGMQEGLGRMKRRIQAINSICREAIAKAEGN